MLSHGLGVPEGQRSLARLRFRHYAVIGRKQDTRVSGVLPTGLVGGFGPHLQRFILALHIQGQVKTDRLTALLTGMGVVISKHQVVRLLAKCSQKFIAEESEFLRAGLATALDYDRSKRAACAPRRIHHANRRWSLHGVPHGRIQVAVKFSVDSAGRVEPLRHERRRPRLHAPAQLEGSDARGA